VGVVGDATGVPQIINHFPVDRYEICGVVSAFGLVRN
jgi:hypothetical protein